MQRILLLVLMGLLPLTAAADGKVFSQRAVIAEAFIPDQRALICWSNGVQRLVIETRFAGEGTNFAWVVPLPSQPEIEPATSGVFATLAYQLRPELIHQPSPWCSAFLFCVAIGWLVRGAGAGRKFNWQTLAACLLAAVSLIPVSPLAAVFAGLFLIWATERILMGKQSLLEVLVVLLLVLFLAAMLLPTLGTAGIKGGPSSDVTELASARVGAFETKTITAKTSSALLDWLRENEFAVSTNAEPVIADYIKRGWVFVASKLSRDQPTTATNSIHPLSFTFRTEQPVYPMRLTGVDAGPLQVELYVFGAQRAEADKFTVATCVAATFPVESSWQSRVSDQIPIMHTLLRTWAQGCPVVTKLTATLTPAQMQEDVMLRWATFTPQRSAVYSRQAAMITAASWATGLMLGIFGLVFLGTAVRRKWGFALPRITLGVVWLALVVFVGVYALLPKVSVRTGRFHPAFVRHTLQSLAVTVEVDWKDSPPKTLTEARRAVVFEEGMTTNNILLGGSIREEDSPGNYGIRQSTNGFEFFWYDGNGAEQTMRTPR
ncbi:MAG: DUF2330 domain-containing protein [Akkermansiaceae bacterium]|nr:DUF2330 domain-containing protein [Verrucomicrobiales bacterium]